MSRILLVEDEPNIRMVLELTLRDAGYEVAATRNGLEGLEKLKEGFNPDLVIVDLKMPILSGSDFIIRMRSNAYYSETNIVILSGSMPGFGEFPPDDTYQAMLTKPFDLNELLELVNSLCCKRELLSVG